MASSNSLSPYSLSPSPALLLLLVGQTHAHTYANSFSPSPSSSSILRSTSLASSVPLTVSTPPPLSLYMQLTCSVLGTHPLSAPSSQAAALMKEAVLAELNKSARQRSTLRGHLADLRHKATGVHLHIVALVCSPCGNQLNLLTGQPIDCLLTTTS